MTDAVIRVPAPCLGCGGRARRLTPARDLTCATCNPPPEATPLPARTRVTAPTITTTTGRHTR